ncbi:MAG: tryptophan--tRNA ligase [Verrucomicrobiota bacterium]|nr:tryptophan--tRNA ligase [Verrucomicrobiota bacterium]MEC7907728.1 tryptophan--tRNA ligase [Verrucomicrobiota bacterium]MEC8313857.1 tryptophan--tRNA ligase [Verrucomicrobiota bacterium]|tara:strand:- start:161 stop:1123 length:963 start_codon:yes stop_codon:yes gene_type:complete
MNRAISGIQPSGKLHIGNYFGMMKPAIDMQKEHETFLFIADYHALTSVRDPNILKNLIKDAVLDFLACGIDPEKVFLYKQSDVPQVHELSWFLSVLAPMGLLERCHSFKDKLAKGLNSTHGLFSYPILMASDILSIKASIVPVGKDQKQHVEVTRDLAIKFNNLYGEVFDLPNPLINERVASIPGVDGQKMSKSYNNVIGIFESDKILEKKIKKIVTDSKNIEDKKDPESCNIFSLYKLFSNADEQKELAKNYYAGGMGYGYAKNSLLKKINQYFEPMREKRLELEADNDYIEDILKNGAKKASLIASDVLKNVKTAVGL